MKTSINLLILLVIFAFAVSADAQTTEFTYQGSLNVGTPSVPANTPHDFEFRLFAADTGGGALGTLQRLNVQVTNGTFAVKLDFGTQFPGANRYLEISVRPAGAGGFELLSPRQLVSNTPYAVRSLNAANADTAGNATNATNAVNATNAINATNATNATTANNALQLGGVAANQFVQTNDSRLSDSRNPLPNSANYVQNTTTTQASSNFNISGNGIVGGNLGVGTNSPSQKLQIINGTTDIRMGAPNGDGIEIRSSATGHTPALTLTNTATGGRRFRISSYGDGTNGTFFIRDDTGGHDRLSIDRFGRVYNGYGIDESGAIAFASGAVFSGITMENGNSMANFGINTGREGTFNPLAPGYWLRTDVRPGLGGFHFFKKAGNPGGAETELVTITDSGNFGIGSTAPSQKLHVVGNGLVTGDLTVNGTLNATLPTSGNYIQNTGTTQPTSNFNISGNGTIGGTLRVGGIAGGIAGSFGSIGRFDIDAPFSSGGRFTVLENGNVGMGTTTPGAKLHIAAQGQTQLDLQNTTGAGSRWRLFADTVGGGGGNLTFGFFDVTNARLPFGIDNSGNVGIGTTSPTAALTVNGSNNGLRVVTSTSVGTVASFGSNGYFDVDSSNIPGGRLRITPGKQVRINNPPDFPSPLDGNSEALVVNGFIAAVVPPGIGLPVCWNAVFGQGLQQCGVSSIRYKTNVQLFTPGLDLIRRLRPVSFDWIKYGTEDFGLIAEEVNEVEPLLNYFDADGKVQGVKYDRIGVVAVNAIKEQQQEIETLKKQVAALKALLCAMKAEAEICKE